MGYQFGFIYYCFANESHVLHQFEPYLQCLSYINILCSLRKTGGLKIDLEIGISI